MALQMVFMAVVMMAVTMTMVVAMIVLYCSTGMPVCSTGTGTTYSTLYAAQYCSTVAPVPVPVLLD